MVLETKDIFFNSKSAKWRICKFKATFEWHNCQLYNYCRFSILIENYINWHIRHTAMLFDRILCITSWQLESVNNSYTSPTRAQFYPVILLFLHYSFGIVTDKISKSSEYKSLTGSHYVAVSFPSHFVSAIGYYSVSWVVNIFLILS